MSSPRFQKQDEFETSIARDLKTWAARSQAPDGSRAALLRAAAAERSQRSAARAPALKSPAVFKSPFALRLHRWVAAAQARRHPKLPQTELSQWLFTQAMWHNLGTDRRAVRLVC